MTTALAGPAMKQGPTPPVPPRTSCRVQLLLAVLQPAVLLAAYKVMCPFFLCAGRAGEAGSAITLLTPNDLMFQMDLETALAPSK